MELVVIRHAIAMSREEFAPSGADDSLRPLTEEGRRKMKVGAKGLRTLVKKIDVLASSPFARATETATIVSAAYGAQPIITVDALEPDSEPKTFLAWLRVQDEASVVAVVGHEPHLGTLATWLLTGVDEQRVPFGKGGACMIDFEGRPSRGGGSLCWLLTPSILRSLAGT